MAAAEYFAGVRPTQPHPPSPHQAPTVTFTPAANTPLLGPVHNAGPQPTYQSAPQQEVPRPAVHFSPAQRPPAAQQPSFSGQAPTSAPQDYRPPVAGAVPSPVPQDYRPPLAAQGQRPSFSNQSRPTHLGPGHWPPPHPGPQLPSQPHSFHGQYPSQYSPTHPQQFLAPNFNGNQSSLSLNQGYVSDPEHQRRRRRRHSNPRDEHRDEYREERDVRERPRKHRSRSTAADGFIGAAGGGLLGDLLLPGLGTVGGALAGWIGGRDYGKHRKYREDKREREQEDWETRFKRRSSESGEKHHRDREQRNRDRHYGDYR